MVVAVHKLQFFFFFFKLMLTSSKYWAFLPSVPAAYGCSCFYIRGGGDGMGAAFSSLLMGSGQKTTILM